MIRNVKVIVPLSSGRDALFDAILESLVEWCEEDRFNLCWALPNDFELLELSVRKGCATVQRSSGCQGRDRNGILALCVRDEYHRIEIRVQDRKSLVDTVSEVSLKCMLMMVYNDKW